MPEHARPPHTPPRQTLCVIRKSENLKICMIATDKLEEGTTCAHEREVDDEGLSARRIMRFGCARDQYSYSVARETHK